MNEPATHQSDSDAQPFRHKTNESFAEASVNQLRTAVEQAVYGDVVPDLSADPDRAHTIETLTTLGQMGELTETDIDEAKKEYL